MRTYIDANIGVEGSVLLLVGRLWWRQCEVWEGFWLLDPQLVESLRYIYLVAQSELQVL